jgi:hypothetical protein
MTSTADRLIGELLEFVTPLYLALDSPAGFRAFLRRLGHDPTAEVVADALEALATSRQTLSDLVETLGDKAWNNQPLDEADYTRIASEAPEIILAVGRLPDALEAIDLGPNFAAEVLDLMVVDYLRFRAPTLHRGLVLLGVIEVELIQPGAGDDARPVAYEKYTLRWDRVRRFIVEPSGLTEEVYSWGRTDFAADRLLENVALFIDEFGVYAVLRELPDQLANMFDASGGPRRTGTDIPLHRVLLGDVDFDVGLIAFPVKGRTAPIATDRGIAIMPYVSGALTQAIPISDDRAWSFHVEADAELVGGTVFRIHPSGLQVESGVLDNTSPAGSFRMEIGKEKPADRPSIVLFGEPDETRLEAEGLAVGAGGGEDDFYVAAAVRKLHLVLDTSGDGLLSQIIPEPIAADAGDVVTGWRPGRGIYIERGSGLSLRIPLSTNLFGVLRLQEVALELGLDPHASLATLLSARASIGPLSLAFEDLGLELTLVPNSAGTFGAFDIEAGLRSPSGYAAALDAGPIVGGGGLFIHDHEYRGVLNLRFEAIGLSGFAILTTRLPGGQVGFSFIALIFSEFEVPLGYGFFLTGVGGIIGINRMANTDALRQAVADGNLDRVLFPEDPVAEAPRILDALAGLFAPHEGRHVFGPVARIVFGRPTLVEGRLGLVLEVGDQARVLVLGLISSDLPSKDTALVSLRAPFFGDIDLAAGTVSLDATLKGSRVLTYSVGGDIAARTGWAPRLDHVVSFGGLHPAYPRPANFPPLGRLSINFGSNNPRVTLSAYLAVTTNSLQFGADASLYAKGPHIMFVGRIGAEGEVYLNALVYFDPFAFDAELGGSLSLLVDGDVILGLGFDLRLSGPNPFRVSGRVWATVWGVDVGFHIEHSWGEEQPLAPPTTDPVTLLRDALRSGEGVEPIRSTTRVSCVAFTPTAPGSDSDRVADPAAGVQYLQRGVPLGVSIDKVGEAVLSGGPHRYDLVVLSADGDELSLSAAETDFVRGHFWTLTEPERLRAPVYERHPGGFVLGGDRLEVNGSASIDAEYGYEIIPLTRRTGPQIPLPLFEDVTLEAAVFERWSGVHRREVAQPLTPEAMAGIGKAALSVRPVAFLPLGGAPEAAGPLSNVLDLQPDRGRTAPANPAVATYVAAAAA